MDDPFLHSVYISYSLGCHEYFLHSIYISYSLGCHEYFFGDHSGKIADNTVVVVCNCCEEARASALHTHTHATLVILDCIDTTSTLTFNAFFM